MIIGITGGTGCGKTTLLNEIQRCGGLILDCDAIYHQLLAENTDLLAAIEARFPGTVENGTLQRKKLGNIVFHDKNALLDLNKITHKAIEKEVLSRLSCQPKLAAIDAIALFESGLNQLCQVTVAVTAPEEDRIRRLMQRDNIAEEYAKSRIRAQHDDTWFRAKCDYVLVNDGTLADFQTKCVAFLRQVGIMNA